MAVACLAATSSVALAGPGGQVAGGGAAPSQSASPSAPPNIIDPDLTGKQTQDVNWSIDWLGNGKYRLLVQNTSGVGFVNSFDWVAAPGMKITAVTSTSTGSCKVKNNVLACVGNLKPPKCTCLPGGSMTIEFTATGDNTTDPKGVQTSYGVQGSYIAVKTVTPVPYHIPSSLSASSADIPLCTTGQKSTKAKPCASI